MRVFLFLETEFWCDRQESNLYCELRKLVSYPLEDGRVGGIVAFTEQTCMKENDGLRVIA
jgi:hypothetical protein